MSAQLETFFELKKVVDHDCGNYQIGEIDFIDFKAINDYVERYGEFGYKELTDCLIRLLAESRTAIINKRIKESNAAVAYSGT